MAGEIDPLLLHLPVWVLVLFRLAGIFLFAPVLGSAAIPARVKVFLAVGLSFCVYPMLLGRHAEPLLAGDVFSGRWVIWSLPIMIAAEALIGLVIGFAAGLPLMGMQMAGQVSDQQMGMGIGGIFNPDMDEELGVLGQFYYLMAMMLFVIMGGHRVLLATLVGSFESVPLGGFRIDRSVVELLLGLMGTAFELALRVSAPLLCLVFLETVALGFIARTVPQLNILSVGFALRILIGVTVLIGALSSKSEAYVSVLGRSLRELAHFFAPG